MTVAPRPILIEDDACAQLAPLASTRPAFELRCGALNLRERVELALGPPAATRVRPSLRPLLAGHLDSELPAAGEVLLLNARLLATVDQLTALGTRGGSWVVRDGSTLLAARCDAGQAAALLDDAGGSALPVADGLPLRTFEWPWELALRNGAMICEDFRALSGRELPAKRIFGIRLAEGSKRRPQLEGHGWVEIAGVQAWPGVHLLSPQNILMGPGVVLKPGVVLDASDGPILLGRDCVLEANVVVQGPAALGPGCVVNPGARLRHGTSAGAGCKLGGEIEEAVLHDFSNKQHDGFLGHAALGSWVNLGADTNASDLKNNYGPVRVDLGDGPVDSGERFVGPMVGDHAKTGINTMLSTGTVVGVGANIYGAGFPPRFLPAFSWGGAEGLVEYRLADALATAATAMGRRDALCDEPVRELLRAVFEASSVHRARLA